VHPSGFFELIRPNNTPPDQDFGPIPSLRHGCTLPNSRSPGHGTGKTGSRIRRAIAGSPKQRSPVFDGGRKVCGFAVITGGVRSCECTDRLAAATCYLELRRE